MTLRFKPCFPHFLQMLLVYCIHTSVIHSIVRSLTCANCFILCDYFCFPQRGWWYYNLSKAVTNVLSFCCTWCAVVLQRGEESQIEIKIGSRENGLLLLLCGPHAFQLISNVGLKLWAIATIPLLCCIQEATANYSKGWDEDIWSPRDLDCYLIQRLILPCKWGL